jgi:DNA-binding PadR family transcriptional regulator
MFSDVLQWILEDKEIKNSHYFCEQKNISEKDFYFLLATLEKEYMIKKYFLTTSDNPHLAYHLTEKGKAFLNL